MCVFVLYALLVLGHQNCCAEGHTAPVKDVVWISSHDSSKSCAVLNVSYLVGSEERLLFASASQDQNVHIWSLDTGTQQQEVGNIITLQRTKV